MIILSFQTKRDDGKKPPPEVPQRERLSRLEPEAGEGVEEMNVEKGDEDDNEPPHYLLRRVKRRFVFRTTEEKSVERGGDGESAAHGW